LLNVSFLRGNTVCNCCRNIGHFFVGQKG